MFPKFNLEIPLIVRVLMRVSRTGLQAGGAIIGIFAPRRQCERVRGRACARLVNVWLGVGQE